MKAATLTALRTFEIQEVPTPVVEADTDVLLRARAVGVCGSDIHYFTEGRIGDQVIHYPHRIGHEFSAIVEEVGTKVSRVSRGDLVAVDPAMPCGQCDQCQRGRPNTCRRIRFLGVPGEEEGCLAEYIVMPENCCFPVPKGFSEEVAAIIEPLSIGIYAVGLAGLAQGTKVGILGCGPIGLSVLLPAASKGASAVYVTDKIDDRLRVAHRAGAAWVGNPLKEDIVSEISRREPSLLDIVFECCGQQEALDQAMELLAPGGKLMVVGIPGEDRVSFSVDDMRRKEVCIQNVRRQADCVEAAIDFIAAGHDVSFMITHRFALEETNAAYELVAGYRDGVVKAMIHP